MTLIAAFRYTEGVVICADSQETAGDWRISVDKLTPRDAGGYQIAVGGAGRCGDLIDGFTERMADDAMRWPAGLDERALKSLVQVTLVGYYDHEVRAYPLSTPDDGIMDFLFCVRRKTDGKVFLWKLSGTAIATVDNYALIGHGNDIYQHEANRLYEPDTSAVRCMLLGVHLFTFAKNTSNYIGGDTQIVGFVDTSKWEEDYLRALERVQPMYWREPPEAVHEWEERMAFINSMTTELLMTCSDSTVTTIDFSAMAEKLSGGLVKLHEAFVHRAIRDHAIYTASGYGIPPYARGAMEAIPVDAELKKLFDQIPVLPGAEETETELSEPPSRTDS